MSSLFEKLNQFRLENRINTKGPLCVVLVITRNVKGMGFPLNMDDFVTDREGQVKGLGVSAVQSILKDYGITKTLAKEGGRTSRGSLGLMKNYINFLNENCDDSSLTKVESWWVERIKDFFSQHPFRLSVDPSKTASHCIELLIKQAEDRQRENPGTTYVGALIQHLVGAKLQVALKNDDIECFGYSVSDDQNSRKGDFLIGDSIVHVTTHPQDALFSKCKLNIEQSLRPIIVTTNNGCIIAKAGLELYSIRDRVDIYEISQFLSININELSSFKSSDTRSTFESIVNRYNAIIESSETDPSLMISIG